MNPTHAQAVEDFRKAQEELWATGLTDSQAASLVALMNAGQALNALYWEQAAASKEAES